MIQKKALASPPNLRTVHADGYVNLLNKYGTQKDSSQAYQFEAEPDVPDMELAKNYEGNGLFSKIIDRPSDEAVKHGIEYGISNTEITSYLDDTLDKLDWEGKFSTAIKWARLFGGSIIVMLIDDGNRLEEPVNWDNIQSIDELRVYERPLVQPDWESLYNFNQEDASKRVGEATYYTVNSVYGMFTVHRDRCLIFRNGTLPEFYTQPLYRFWGMPEYIRIRKELTNTVTTHGNSSKMLEKSVQAIYKMDGLAANMSTQDGEEAVLKRLQTLDLARGILNSIAIDSAGEDYDFKTFQLSGVKDIIEASCNMLSAVTNIPQTLLFGRSPSGENSTGDSDMENYYNYVENIQKTMLKQNMRILSKVMMRAGLNSGSITEDVPLKLQFKPLWSLSETEQATVDQTKAATALTKAQTTQVYVDMQALDPSEVRTALSKSGEYIVEDILDNEDTIEDWGIPPEFIEPSNISTDNPLKGWKENEQSSKPASTENSSTFQI